MYVSDAELSDPESQKHRVPILLFIDGERRAVKKCRKEVQDITEGGKSGQ